MKKRWLSLVVALVVSLPVFASGTLVVYFSGTGNTGRVAEMVAKAAGADTFVLEPQKPYTRADLNYRDPDSRVNREHEQEALRDVPLRSVEVPDFDRYDTVFLGYPIWWRDASWVVDGFVRANDFTGKRVIPFCTSSSSGIGDSGKHLAAMAGSGTWLEGRRFSSWVSEAEVSAWVKEVR